MNVDVQITTQGLEQVEEFLHRFARELNPAALASSAGVRAVADALLESHQQAFAAGGHQGHGGPIWEPTHPYWVKHMSGNTSKPLVWTGEAAASLDVSIEATADGVMITLFAKDYLQKFQWGPWAFTETFPVEWMDIDDPEPWVKVPEGGQVEAGLWTDEVAAAVEEVRGGNWVGAVTKNITIIPREVFFVGLMGMPGPHLTDPLLDVLGKELGIG